MQTSFRFDTMIPQLLFITGVGDSLAIASRMQASSQDENLTELFLSGVHVDATIVSTVAYLLEQDRWEGLHLGQECTGMVAEILEIACREVAKISILNDSNSRRLEPSWCRALCKGLQNHPTIKKLMLRVTLSNDLAAALYEGMRHLEELVLPISDASMSAIILLAGALQNCQSLRKLKLNRHDLVWTVDECQIKTLMQALENHESLKELSIQGSSCEEAGIRVIADCLVHKLEKLDLSNHRFGGDRLLGTDYLASHLRGSTLKYLSLAGHRLLEKEIALLADTLARDDCQLEEVCLTNCSISDKSITNFATRLPQMKSLKRLWLHDNPFHVEGGTAILNAMEFNFELEQVVVPRGRQEPMSEIQQDIEYYLLLNRAGRRLLRHGGHVPRSIWPKVLSRVSETKTKEVCFWSAVKERHQDAIFHLLQGPALLER
jgi:hypothetical protein